MPKFEKGNTYSLGRPRGSRNKATVWLDELGAEGTAEIIRVVDREARKGDMRAAWLMLSRTWPHRRGRLVELDLPPVETSAGLVQAHAAVVAALSRAEITPDEAASIATVLETQRRAIETHDHERRIRALQKTEDAPEWPTPDRPVQRQS
jgi:hypothetical protein